AEGLDSGDLAQLRQLAAAALHDVAGLRQAAVGEWIYRDIDTQRRVALMAGSAPDHGDTRVVRRSIASGRKLWVRLAAWPWWAIADEVGEQNLVRELRGPWWKLARVVETYRLWEKLGPDGTRALSGWPATQ